MKKIAIYNNKGGVGKTTTTKMLAKNLVKRGNKVLLIDLDPQGNLSSQYKKEIGSTINTVNELLLTEIHAKKCTYQVDKNLAIIISDLNLLKANNQMLLESLGKNPMTRLKKKLLEIENDFDYVLLDCPPTMDLLVSNALAVADDVIIPLRADNYSLDGISMLLDKIDEIKLEENDDLKVAGIFLNAVKQSNLTNELIDYLKELNLFVDVQIGDYIAVGEDTFNQELENKKLENHKVTSQFDKLFEELGVL